MSEYIANLGLRERPITTILSAAEQAAVLAAYDDGIDRMDTKQRQQLDNVITELKRKIWP